MLLQERLQADFKESLRTRDTHRKQVLTLLRSGLASAAKDKKEALTEQEEIAVIQREVKQTRQSLAEAERFDRQDVVSEMNQKIAILEEYLPQQLSAEEVKSRLTELGIHSGMLMGDAMKIAKPALTGKSDNALIAKVVKELIS